MSKTYKELEAEIKRLENEASEKFQQASKLKAEMLAQTNSETKEYIGKYIIYYHDDYCHYLYVTTSEANVCERGWTLKGYGFTAYIDHKTGVRHFNMDPYGYDLNDDYYTLEIITKERFYEDRKKYLEEVMNYVCPEVEQIVKE